MRSIISASIGPIDLCHIFSVGRNVTVDVQHEISFSITQGTLPQRPIFVVFIPQPSFSDIQWMASASGRPKSSSV